MSLLRDILFSHYLLRLLMSVYKAIASGSTRPWESYVHFWPAANYPDIHVLSRRAGWWLAIEWEMSLGQPTTGTLGMIKSMNPNDWQHARTEQVALPIKALSQTLMGYPLRYASVISTYVFDCKNSVPWSRFVVRLVLDFYDSRCKFMQFSVISKWNGVKYWTGWFTYQWLKGSHQRETKGWSRKLVGSHQWVSYHWVLPRAHTHIALPHSRSYTLVSTPHRASVVLICRNFVFWNFILPFQQQPFSRIVWILQPWLT